jgi:vitamin B12 transporter
MLKNVYFCLTFLCVGWSAFSQENNADSVIWLEGLTIKGIPQERYAVGSRVQQLDSLQMTMMNGQSLGQALMAYTPVYIKSYGNGMLSTISFRGTQANHTAVLWEGINMNMPSLGLSDFSNFPIFFFDQIALQAGPGSALYGSDALGGSVFLKNNTQQNDRGWNVEMQQNVGSFQTYFTGLKGGFSHQKGYFHLKAFRQSSANNFRFINTTKLDAPLERQDNASFTGEGWMVDAGVKTGKKHFLEFSHWETKWNREIQPTMTRNSSEDWQADASKRTKGLWRWEGRDFQARLGSFYIEDQINYNGSISKTYRWIQSAQTEYRLGENIQLHTGYQWQRITADISNYPEEALENRHDAFGSLLWEIWDETKLAFNIRQSWVSGYEVPFTPSLGISSAISPVLQWTALVAKTYRAPTLNERFWQPGGNLNILPEDGWSVETGLLWNKVQNQKTWHAGGNVYSQWVDNWILWRPTLAGFWAPENIREVWARGVELQAGVTLNLSKEVAWNHNFQYSFTRSTYRNDELMKGNQLIYVPKHMGIYHSRIYFRKWFLEGQGIYTGKRYTTSDNRRSLSPYLIFNGGLGTTIELFSGSFQVMVRGNNLSNMAYQNYEFRAMPGINGQLSVIYQWKQ